LVAQCKLNLPRAVDHSMTTPAWHPEVLISRPPVNPPKDMPVEGIGDIRLEQDILPFSNASSFDDGKILILISRTSPPGDNSRKVSKDITSSSCQRRSARVDKRTAINGLRRGRNTRSIQAVGCCTAAIPAGISGGRPFRGIGEKDRLSPH